MDRLRIALIGSRGIPANYGGFETLFEHLAGGLVDRGFDVTVYCRNQYTPAGLEQYKGAKLVTLPTIRRRHFDTPAHTLLSVLHAASEGFDAALVVNGANCIFVPVLQAVGIPVALNVDGIERQRTKWGRLGKTVYSISEKLSAITPNRLVSDALVIQKYYLKHYGVSSSLISYGVEADPLPPGPVMKKLGLEPRMYFLYVSRFEPENNPHLVAEAYRDMPGDLPLVMVGGAPYSDRFIESFTHGADPRIIFPGPIYGDGYRELLSHALAYIQATQVGGSHPALIEAMGYGNCLLVNNTPEHHEVAGEAALYFEIGSQTSLLDSLEHVADNSREVASLRQRAAQRAQRLYNWNRVVDDYSRLFTELAKTRRQPKD